MNQKTTITVNLKEILKEKNISQKELALMTGIRESTISEISRNSKTVLNFEHFEKICEVLDIKDIRELIKLTVK